MCLVGYPIDAYRNKEVLAWKVVTSFKFGFYGTTFYGYSTEYVKGVRYVAKCGVSNWSRKTTDFTLKEMKKIDEGFYSFNTRAEARRFRNNFDRRHGRVFRVKLSGKIIEYTNGYRSDYFEILKQKA